MNHGAAMGRVPVGSVVDVQIVPVCEFKTVKLPTSLSAPDLDGLAETLTQLSAEGFSFALTAVERGYVVLSRPVAMRKLAVDTSQIVMPMRAPIAQ